MRNMSSKRSMLPEENHQSMDRSKTWQKVGYGRSLMGCFFDDLTGDKVFYRKTRERLPRKAK